MRRLCSVLLAVSCTLICATAGADAGTKVGGRSEPVVLHAQDLDVMRNTVCSRYGVASESVGPALRWTYGRQAAPVIEVPVRCAPHASVNGLPSHYNVACRRDDDRRRGDWQCHGWEAITVRTQIGDLSIEPGPYPYDVATRAVQAALDSSLFRHEVRDALPSGCRLASNWSAQGDEVAELSCASGHRFLFSLWCPTGACPRLMTATSLGE